MRAIPLASRLRFCDEPAKREGRMLGFEMWEWILIATGAFWGGWFMWRRSKKAEEEQKNRE